MKNYLSAIVFGGFIITIILQAVSFAGSGIQSGRLQKQITDINQKLDKLQSSAENTQALISKTSTETVLGVVANTNTQKEDPNDLLTPDKLAITLDEAVSNAVKLKPSYNNIDVYETTKTSSRITGQLLSNIDYPIISKQAGWFLIKLDSQTNAWVQAQFVNEKI